MTPDANSSLLDFAVAGSFYDIQAASDAVGGVTMWEKAREQLLRIAKLDANWDGDGAPAVSSPIIRSATWLLRTLLAKGYPSPNDLYPTPDGYVIVEWQFSDDVIMRIEVDGLGTGEKMVSYPDAPCRFERKTWPTADRPRWHLAASGRVVRYINPSRACESVGLPGRLPPDSDSGCGQFSIAA